jgi:hypothetical protein
MDLEGACVVSRRRRIVEEGSREGRLGWGFVQSGKAQDSGPFEICGERSQSGLLDRKGEYREFKEEDVLCPKT